MDDLRFGRLLRVLRQRSRLRQRDVAARARVSSSTIVRVESGDASAVRVGSLRAIGAAVGVRVEIDARWRGGDEDRLLDAGHAALVEATIAHLRRSGWDVLAEYSFNHYGDRGSVDVVGWHGRTRTLLIVEVKTKLLDLQNLVSRLDRKTRVVPRLLAGERTWQAVHVGRIVIAEESSWNRRVVAAHPELFASSFPARSREVRRWLRAPDGPLRGIWFLSEVPTTTLRQRVHLPTDRGRPNRHR